MTPTRIRGLTRLTLEETPIVCHSCVWWQSKTGRQANKNRWIDRAEDDFGPWGALYYDDDLHSAERHAERSVTLAPRDPEALRTLSVIRKLQGRTAEAVEIARAAVSEAPQLMNAISSLLSDSAINGMAPFEVGQAKHLVQCNDDGKAIVFLDLLLEARVSDRHSV